MPIRIDEFNVTVPDGTIIGVLGEGPVPITSADPMELLARRQEGEILFVRGIDPRVCDEGWWIHEGQLRRGDPAEILRASGQGFQMPLRPSLRRGDGRARLLAIETLDAASQPTMTWNSGEEAQVRVAVEFLSRIEQPVVGMMIQTRLGFEVFGTNTELEELAIGPVEEGTRRLVTFSFRCDLCPQEYTVTAASHDPDGRWHDWVEDAVAFRVTDRRYTAGVANLRARVRCE
jgi:lipopolysaccharide transport system ATP-binding protein